jgi:hypothetical protein
LFLSLQMSRAMTFHFCHRKALTYWNLRSSRFIGLCYFMYIVLLYYHSIQLLHFISNGNSLIIFLNNTTERIILLYKFLYSRFYVLRNNDLKNNFSSGIKIYFHYWMVNEWQAYLKRITLHSFYIKILYFLF